VLSSRTGSGWIPVAYQLSELVLVASRARPAHPHAGNPPKTKNVGRINPPKILGLSLVLIPRFLDFIGTHFTD
jgi:hypothetical protein